MDMTSVQLAIRYYIPEYCNSCNSFVLPINNYGHKLNLKFPERQFQLLKFGYPLARLMRRWTPNYLGIAACFG